MISDAHITIIGGGMMGLSCAYWLSKFGAEDIVIVDRYKELAADATKECAGMITQDFSDKTMINLAQESLKLYRHISCGMRNQGQIVLFEKIDEIADAKKRLAEQKRAHVQVKEMGKGELYHLIPAAYIDDIEYALHYPGDAIADVERLMTWFKDECEANEVRFILGTTVRNVHSKEGKVLEVMTDKGTIKTEKIINAAGAHAGIIGHLAGIDVPVLPLRIHSVTTGKFPVLSDRMPAIRDEKYNITIVPHEGGFRFLQRYHHEEHGFKTGIEERFIYDMLDDAEKRFPAFASAKIKEKSSGHYAMTPDKRPIIGETSLKGLYCCAGFNGHGMTFAPIAGMIIADLIMHGDSRHGFSGLEPDRFRR